MTIGNIFAIVVSVASLVQGIASAHRAKKRQKHMKREAELRADLQKGLQFPEEAVAKPLAVVYGRQKVGGVRVHFAVRSNYRFAPPKPGGIVLEALSRKREDGQDWELLDALNGFDESGLKYDPDGNPIISDPSRLKLWKKPNAPVTVYRFRGGHTPVPDLWKDFITPEFRWFNGEGHVPKEVLDLYGLEPSSYAEFQSTPGYWSVLRPRGKIFRQHNGSSQESAEIARIQMEIADRQRELRLTRLDVIKEELRQEIARLQHRLDELSSGQEFDQWGRSIVSHPPPRPFISREPWVKPVIQQGKAFIPEHIPMIVYVPFSEGTGKPAIHPGDVGLLVPDSLKVETGYEDRNAMALGKKTPLNRDGKVDPSLGEYAATEGEVRVWRITDAYDKPEEARLVQSSVQEFLDLPGYICTEENPNVWKFPSREVKDAAIRWQVPTVDFVYAAFHGGDQSIHPKRTLREMGFEFPDNESQKYPVMDRDMSGRKREFYFVQQAISFGGLAEIYGADVDGKSHTYDPFSYGMRMHIYPDGGWADPLMVLNDHTRADARFDNIAYATMVFKLNRDDPQFGGTPDVSFYVQGNPPHEVLYKDGSYMMGNRKVSSNPPLVLLDHLMNPEYGRGLPVDKLDLESFARAARICDTVMVSDAIKRGTIWRAKPKDAIRNIHLYECNITLDTSRTIRDRIQAILNTMLDATLVWSDGKYRLNLPYVFVYFEGLMYQVGDHVQVIDQANRQRLFRCVQQSKGNHPLTSPTFWVEDVIPDHLKDVNDDDIEIGSEVLIEWPDSDSKLNHLSVKFYNEDKDFAEDTASWPEKEPKNPNDTVYKKFMEEDLGIKLESEITLEGCSTAWHAKAFAEHRVRMSRETNVYVFSGLAKTFQLEPGDLFGFSSRVFDIPYTILRVESIETQAEGPIRITATTFDARLAAWNVEDDQYVPLPDRFKGHTLRQAYNLDILAGGTDNKSSGYILTWSPAPDDRVVRYQIKYTTDRVSNVTPSTAWVDLGKTSGTKFELPALEGDFTFTVVSESAEGRIAPFRDIVEGSEWPLLGYTLTAGHLEQGVIGMELTNNLHTFPTQGGSVVNYRHSNTEVFCYFGHTQMVYDGIGTAPGTYRLVLDGVGITPGALKSNPAIGADIGDHSNMTGPTAEVFITAHGTTPAGAVFKITRSQKLRTKENAHRNGVFHILVDPGVVYKDADALGKPGPYTRLHAAGYSDIDGQVAPYGYVTVETNKTPEEGAYHGEFELKSDPDSQVEWYRLRMYVAPDRKELLDEEMVIVLPRGERGPGAISAHLSNSSHVIPCKSDKTVITYEGAGTSVYVFEGTERLKFVHGKEPGNGEYTGDLQATNISVNGIRENDGVVTLSDYRDMTADVAVVHITVRGFSSKGEAFDTKLLQTLVKVVQPDSVVAMRLSNPLHVFEKDVHGNIKTYDGSYTDITVLEGSEPLRYDGVGEEPGTYRLEAVADGIAVANVFTKVGLTDARSSIPYNMTAEKAQITYTAYGKTRSGHAGDVGTVQNFMISQKGERGDSAMEVYLFRWSPVRPESPTGNSMLQPQGKRLLGYTPGPNELPGWEVNIPANPGGANMSLWRASKLAVFPNSGENVALNWTDAHVTDITRNGADGEQGVSSAAAQVYCWSGSQPAAPAGRSTYHWSTGQVSNLSPYTTGLGWATSPGSPRSGQTLWVAEVRVLGSGRGTQDFDWTGAMVSARSYAGGPGTTHMFAYAVHTASSMSAKSTRVTGKRLPTPSDNHGLNGLVWQDNAPHVGPNQRLWQCDGVYDPETNSTTWNAPYWSSFRVADLSAISANMGTIVAGRMVSHDNKFVIDMNAKVISIEV